MSILINDTGNLIYLGEETRTSKNDNKFTLVTIGDSLELQRHDFFKDEHCDTSNLSKGEKVKIEVNIDTVGYNQRLSLINVTPVK